MRDEINAATAQLAKAGVAGPDALELLAFVLELDVRQVRAGVARGDTVDASALERFHALVERRAAREPLQHLTKRAYFRYLELRVGPGVFVPRPETEILVDRALESIAGIERPVVVDACSGSGAIALAIATERAGSDVTAIEASPEAAEYAAANIAAIAPAVTLLQQPFTLVDAESLAPVDLLVSNPPYVPSDAIPRDPEVRLHDPALALYSGHDGLDAIRDLAKWGASIVRDGGAIALEHGEWQGAEVCGVLAAHGWVDAVTSTDLTGRDRVTVARRVRATAEPA